MNFYDELGLKPDASDDDVKSAYRSRSKAVHPDKPGGSHEAQSKVNRAYEILSNPESRERFDRGESPDERSIADEARAALINIFMSVVQDPTVSLDHTDIFKATKVRIEASQNDMRQTKANLKRDMARLASAKTRITGKDTFFGDVLDGRIKNNQIGIDNLDRNITIGNMMIAILADYKYRTDQLPGIQSNSGGFEFHGFQINF